MTHLKREVAPTSWTIARKEGTFTTKPHPGAHPQAQALPVGTLLKQLNYAKTTKEAKKIINQRALSVDARPVSDHHFSVGFMDLISVADTHFRCTLDRKGRLHFKDVPKTEQNKKISKIIGKHPLKKGKTQFNLSDGRNIITDNKDHKVGDSVMLELPGQKITAHYPLKEGSTAFLLGGRHKGAIITIKEIDGNTIKGTMEKEPVETLKQFTFVIGKDKPALTL